MKHGATTALLADIGGTHARFALVDGAGVIAGSRTLECADYTAIEDAIEDYLACEGGPGPRDAALAVAAPVTGDLIALTNHPWSFSVAGLKRRLQLNRLAVVNDFMANALALPHLGAEDKHQLGRGMPVANTPIGIIGPGTGLGVGGLVPGPGGWIALASEGGHATMPAATARESAVLDHLREHYSHVSAERVLSGPGLVNLYTALAAIDSVPAEAYGSVEIADPQLCIRDRLCREAVALFCAMLGTVAGNLALTLGARGGVYIAGGIVPKLGAVLDTSEFRARFEEKGRSQAYLAPIPTFVVLHPVPAFLGLAALLREA